MTQLPQDTTAQLRARLAAGDMAFGCFLSLGNALAAEIMGNAGYDWALIDLEHGAGDERDAQAQMQALSAAGCAAIVRVEGSARQRAHRVLDFGAHGIMFPRIDTPEEAQSAVAAMRYQPEGLRGVAFSNRACGFGSNLNPYMAASRSLITVVQIESVLALENAGAIAAVDGVDVLFIGPADLSYSMGILGQFTHPNFRSAVERVSAAAAAHGKHWGILLPAVADLESYRSLGARFIACGSDAVMMNNAARATVAALHGK